MSVKDCGHHHCDKRRKWIRRIFAGTLIFLFIVLLAILIIWAILQPTKPRFLLQDATVFAFNLSVPNVLTSVFQVTVQSRNPNDHIGIYYDKLNIYAVYRDQQITLPTDIPPAYEDTQQLNIWSPFIYGNNVPIAPFICVQLGQDRANGDVLLIIKMDGQVRWKVGAFVSGSYRIHVSCPALINFGNANTGAVVANNGIKDGHEPELAIGSRTDDILHSRKARHINASHMEVVGDRLVSKIGEKTISRTSYADVVRDRNGKVSESSESGTRRNIAGSNGPVPVNTEAEDMISEFQSLINDELRQPEEILMATDREVGQSRIVSAEYADGDNERAMGSYLINDKISFFLEEVVGSELKNEFRKVDLNISERITGEGGIQGIRLGLSANIRPAGVISLGSPMQQVEEMGCDLVEVLDCDSRHRGLLLASWAGLGNVHNQGIAPEASSGDIATCSIQNQNQNINHNKGPDVGKSGGCQSFSKVFRRWKSIKTKARSSASKQRPADNPST
ncbi:hypothetical protein Ancab_031511 [Ancistrocladus abbreviatus]